MDGETLGHGIDVLDVMESCAFDLEPDELDALMQARAAIVELMEAAKGVTWFDWTGNDDDAVQSVDRLRAALTATQGERNERD